MSSGEGGGASGPVGEGGGASGPTAMSSGEGGGASGPVGEGGGASGPTAMSSGEGGGASGPVGEGGGASGPTATAILNTRSVPNMHASSFFILLSFPDNLKLLKQLPINIVLLRLVILSTADLIAVRRLFASPTLSLR